LEVKYKNSRFKELLNKINEKNMMKKLGITVCTLIAFANFAVELSPAQKVQLERLNKEKIKAYWIYAGGGNYQGTGNFVKAKQAGFNLACIQYKPQILPAEAPPITNEATLSRKAVKEMSKNVAEAKANGIVPIFSLYMLNSEIRKELLKHNYRKLVAVDGREAGCAPCPLEKDYWNQLRKPMILSVARALAANDTIGGVSLESELYGEKFLAENDQRWQFCFCDECFARFAKEKKLDVPPDLKKTERGLWITKAGLNSEYQASMRVARFKMIKKIIDEARAINPGFLLAFYPYAPSFINDGDIDAAQTGELPVIIFSAREYYTGYNFLSKMRMQNLFDSKRNIRYLGGLVVGNPVSPLELIMQMQELLQFTDGYWLYWGGTLFTNNWQAVIPGGKHHKLHSEYALQAPQPEYWKCFETASKTGHKLIKIRSIDLNQPQLVFKGKVTGKNLLSSKDTFYPVPLFNKLVKKPQKNKIILMPDGGKNNFLEAVEYPVPVEMGKTYCLSLDYTAIGSNTPMCQLGLGIANRKFAWQIYEFYSLPADNRQHNLRLICKMTHPFATVKKLKALKTPWNVKIHLQAGTAKSIILRNIKLEPVTPIQKTIPVELTNKEEIGKIIYSSKTPELLNLKLCDVNGKVLIDDFQSGMDFRILSENFGIRSFRLVITAMLIPSKPVVKLDRLTVNVLKATPAESK
jgi:hypothetical protein